MTVRGRKLRETNLQAAKVTHVFTPHKTKLPTPQAALTLHCSLVRCLGLLSFLSWTCEFNESSHTKAQKRMGNLPVWLHLVSPVCSHTEKSFQPETAPYSRGVAFQCHWTQNGCRSSKSHLLQLQNHISSSSGVPWHHWKDRPALDLLGLGQKDLCLKGKYCQSS